MTFAIPTTPPTTATQPPTTLQDNLQCISIAQTKCMNEIADPCLRTLLPTPGPLIPHSDVLAWRPSRKKLSKRRRRLFISMSMDVCWFAGLENSTHFGGGIWGPRADSRSRGEIFSTRSSSARLMWWKPWSLIAISILCYRTQGVCRKNIRW
jgi:hypothetical protein